MGMPTDRLRAELLRLELSVAQRRTADLPGGSYETVMHPLFHETGASGRWWTREAILEALEGAEVTDVQIERFEIEVLSGTVVLATFDTGGDRPARRASIWIHADGQWRLRFHQGTLLG